MQLTFKTIVLSYLQDATIIFLDLCKNPYAIRLSHLYSNEYLIIISEIGNDQLFAANPAVLRDFAGKPRQSPNNWMRIRWDREVPFHL